MMIRKRKKELIRLIKKYRQGKANPQEIAFLETYYEYFRKEAKISSELSDSQKESLKQKIFSNIKAEIQEFPEFAVIPLYKRVYFRIAVAAVFLLLLCATAYLYKGNRATREMIQAQTKQVKNDVAPGGNKAVLTLADGSRIILDSAADGALTIQGNSRVIKLNDGRLAYNATGDETRQIFYNTISTPHGGQYEVILPDGTHVWLNSVSSLRFPTAFTGNSRQVELTGEGYFEVTHNAAQPFTVVVNHVKVNVLGTKFNVMGYADEEAIKTTLVEGSVKVFLSGDPESVIIKPGQQARLNYGDHKFKVVNPDMEEVLSWKNGEFRFRETNIKTIMRQIARWYNVEIEYKGDLSEVVLSGVMPKKQYASQLLEVLGKVGKIHFVLDNKKIIVGTGK
jgi:transmembrane sensor